MQPLQLTIQAREAATGKKRKWLPFLKKILVIKCKEEHPQITTMLPMMTTTTTTHDGQLMIA